MEGWKFCPFCGNNDLEITSEEIYRENYMEHGGATIGVRCYDCDAEKYEHTVKEYNYKLKVERLRNQWNMRVSV